MSDAVAAAWIAVLGVAFTATATLLGVWLQSRKTRQQLDTGNGHTIGQAVARLEDMAWKHETRLDSVEVQIQEGRNEIEVIRKLTDAHLIEVTPMISDFKVIREEHYQELLKKAQDP